MDSNADLLREFARYADMGYITRQEMGQISDYLRNHTASAPQWLHNLASACVLVANGQIGSQEFANIKRQLLTNLNQEDEGPIRAQVIDVRRVEDVDNKKETQGIVRTGAIIAACIGLLPLPVADAPFLILTQFWMLYRLCGKFGKKPGKSLWLIVLAALIGPILFDALVKIIPFAGSIIGACVAGGITWYIGTKARLLLEKGLEFNFANFWAAKISQ